MNQIKAVITNIETQENLALIEFDFLSEKLTMITLDINKSLKTGDRGLLNINPSQVAIAKTKSIELSYSNQLKAKIIEIETGKLLCSLTLELKDKSKIGALITSKSAKKMALKKGDDVLALLKASQISLQEIING